MDLKKSKANFGTSSVFFTAISTILGAVMFLRFGYAVGNLGFLGTLGVILFGHLVTIATAMAIAEIATNQKVEGGGEYYIISRSFGINIGAAIGIALYLSQAVSVAFYIIAFAEAFVPVIDHVNIEYGILIDKRLISLPMVVLLSVLITKRGADIGMKALYVVVGVLFVALILFFVGETGYQASGIEFDMTAKVDDNKGFFFVFAIIFPAFTGMTSGVGLSGNLKDPKKSIPMGTVMATVAGMIIYIFIAYKLAVSASPYDLVNNQLIMSKIAVWGWWMIPFGLACATISSALGSIMVAPRTLQALAGDKIFPVPKINMLLAKGKPKTNEPYHATIVTSIIAFIFVVVGDVNIVAEIISMFFMITYGSICLISFLQHFAADPSYRPSFRSNWMISLIGALLCIYLMFSMNPKYAFIAVALMGTTYVIISNTKKDREGLVKIFQGVVFQLSRRLQVFIQNAERREENWRPSVICISSDFFHRPMAFNFMRWVSHRYGFGTYIHYIDGYFSKESYKQSKEELTRLIKISGENKSNVYLDTMISPSFTSAIAQAIQLPSVSGKDINMILFEYAKYNPGNLNQIVENFTLARAATLDICILGSSEKEFGFMNNIHIWITPADLQNSNLMIMMGYVLMGHPDWKKAQIKIFAVFPVNEMAEQRIELLELIKTGRLPISANNVELIAKQEEVSMQETINERSRNADLTIVGFRSATLKQRANMLFEGYEGIGNILYVNAAEKKEIG